MLTYDFKYSLARWMKPPLKLETEFQFHFKALTFHYYPKKASVLSHLITNIQIVKVAICFSTTVVCIQAIPFSALLATVETAAVLAAVATAGVKVLVG